ncbi:MAG: chromosome segregation protein SMC [Gammaproteobacteria bacterium]|nr:chromosome segregation protein SMC [Gammaproteobacteria bacterium]
MRLKQIKLAGFKSFVDPTTVSLPGNRCAVVGPNGCGKSNIIDAVRWVMGESSAKQLRGENITDVIFNGSNTRKPTAQASIELVFDNSDGRIGGEYSAYAEIAIRRQVTRDAQSSYFLNGNRCRRKDILDIFLGTGFGPRSYSIIEQGMISQLVEAKPEELRVYLEEAAGISKYKERRRETENRIRHTRENLERLTDLREELGRQLDRLQRQARAAERYKELKAEERRLTAELHTLRYVNLHATLEARQSEIRELEVALEKAASEQQHIDTEIERRRSRHADASEEFNKVQGRYYQIGADIARVEEAIQFNQQRVKQLELDLDTVAQRSEEASRQLGMDEAEIEALRGRIGELEPQVETASDEDRASSEALASLESRNREWQQEWETLNRQVAEHERTAEVQASRVDHVEQLLARLRSRREQLEADAERVPVVASDDVDSLAQEIAALDEERRHNEQDIDRCLADLGAAREEVLENERVLDDARGDVQTLRHELASLEAVQQAALGRDERQAHDWLGEHGLGDARRLGELLAVAPGWERAVETVLGDYLQAIPVARIDDYEAALAGLSEGGVTLVEGRVEAEYAGELPSLASLVRSQDLKLGSVLHGVYAAETADVAFAERRRLAPQESIITRQGIWVGPDWVRVLGRADEEAGIIERAQQIDTLSLRVEEAERHLGDLQGRVARGRARVEALEAERERAQSRSNELNQRLGELKTDHGVRRVQKEEADARRERMRREGEELDAQIAQEVDKLGESRTALAEAEQAREIRAEERAAFALTRQDNERELEAARDAARNARDRYHALNGELGSLRSRLSASETARQRLLRQRQELEEQQRQLENGIQDNARPLPELKAELEAKLESRVAEEAKLGEVRSSLETIDAEVRELEAARGEAENQLAEVRSKLESARVDRQGLMVEERNLVEQVKATGFELEAVKASLAEDASEEAAAEALAAVDRRIQRLGPINLAAIDEYESQSERKEYLDQQNEDLEQALDTLLTAIRKIDKETRLRFKETFEKVNARLGELFPKIFGGGHAYLELTGEDLLDTGVSLMARPPGKRNASVHLLSGGEKAMTAVALIFAIFHLNPSPVCLLDEVDAPLDDANVSRFAELIKEMSADVQFVIITHNKITMEMADHLMGVTMNEPGASRLVSVDVEEAAAMAG